MKLDQYITCGALLTIGFLLGHWPIGSLKALAIGTVVACLFFIVLVVYSLDGYEDELNHKGYIKDISKKKGVK